MRVPQQDCEKLLISGAAAADRLFRYSSVMFRMICEPMGNMVWLTRVALFEEMYTASVRRMDLQILRSKALSRLGEVASKLWWGSGSSGAMGFSGC
jgi:hypothetical protein